jgi:hypothetical protein
MKRIVFTLNLFILFLFLSPRLIHAYSLNDNFDLLRNHKWEAVGTINNPFAETNWHIENGTLRQDTGVDGAMLEIEKRDFANVTASVDLMQAQQGAGLGIVFWFQDSSNWAHVIVAPGLQLVGIDEVIHGVSHFTPYTVNSLHDGSNWYNLKTEIGSTNGVVNVYINSELVATRIMISTTRSGKLGLETGNAGGWFDNFRLIDKLQK